MVLGLKYLVRIGQILPLESNNVNVSLVSFPIIFNFNSSQVANAQNLYQAQRIRMLKDKVKMYKQLYKKQRDQKEYMRRQMQKLEKENRFYKENMSTNHTFIDLSSQAAGLTLFIYVNGFYHLGMPFILYGVSFAPLFYIYSIILGSKFRIAKTKIIQNDFEQKMS